MWWDLRAAELLIVETAAEFGGKGPAQARTARRLREEMVIGFDECC